MESTPVKQTIIAEYNLDVGKFTFYPNILVGEFKEGVHVTFESVTFPIQVSQMTFGSEKPVVYISHRLNSYSMDPLGYKELVDLFPNFIAFAIVAQNRRRRMLVHLERLFIKQPTRVFSRLEDAVEWAEEMIEKAS